MHAMSRARILVVALLLTACSEIGSGNGATGGRGERGNCRGVAEFVEHREVNDPRHVVVGHTESQISTVLPQELSPQRLRCGPYRSSAMG